jgi:hypothetical protein
VIGFLDLFGDRSRRGAQRAVRDDLCGGPSVAIGDRGVDQDDRSEWYEQTEDELQAETLSRRIPP